MPVRRSRRSGSLEEVVTALPDRFRRPEVRADDGAMASLRTYTRDLSEHLRQELGLRRAGDPRGTARDTPPTDEVMAAIGIPPAAWYHAVMTAPRHEHGGG